MVCYHTPEIQLKRLLESILLSVNHLTQQQPAFASNLFIVDNSEHSTVSLELFNHYKKTLGEFNVRLKLTQGHGNIGYGRAHNIPLSELSSDYHLVLNHDVVISETALHNALKALRTDHKIKLLSPKATDKYGRDLFLCKRYPSVLTLALRAFLPRPLEVLFARRLANYEMRDLSESKSAVGVPLISGCFMLAETASLKLIGGFDENYFLYFEDFDLSIRMGKLGEVVYAPDVQIIHDGGNAAGKGGWHIRKFTESGLKFFKTHGWRWT